MYQQINLYQPVFRRQRKVFSAATLLQVMLIAAIVLLGMYLHARWTLGHLQTTVDNLAGQYRQLEAQLGDLENPQAAGSVDVLDEVRRLQQTIDQRQTLLDGLARLAIRDNHAFGDFFEVLATRITPGLWLTGLSLTDDGTTELRGAALDPELVPRYLQDMPRQPRFSELQQGSVHISREDPGNAAVQFVLSSSPREML
ncbi:MAG: PilN domain-containing protein [Thiohalobacterales bacterium]|nr:PilN domain-containing protein [Thiohalobacterales bacterium]